MISRFKEGADESPVHKFKEQALRVIQTLESPDVIREAMIAIEQEVEAHQRRVSVEKAFTGDTLNIIRALHREKQTYILDKVRIWCRARLKCNIEETPEGIFLSWDDITLFAPPFPSTLDGTGE
jgi:hypothetical protein